LYTGSSRVNRDEAQRKTIAGRVPKREDFLLGKALENTTNLRTRNQTIGKQRSLQMEERKRGEEMRNAAPENRENSRNGKDEKSTDSQPGRTQLA